MFWRISSWATCDARFGSDWVSLHDDLDVVALAADLDAVLVRVGGPDAVDDELVARGEPGELAGRRGDEADRDLAGAGSEGRDAGRRGGSPSPTTPRSRPRGDGGRVPVEHAASAVPPPTATAPRPMPLSTLRRVKGRPAISTRGELDVVAGSSGSDAVASARGSWGRERPSIDLLCSCDAGPQSTRANPPDGLSRRTSRRWVAGWLRTLTAHNSKGKRDISGQRKRAIRPLSIGPVVLLAQRRAGRAEPVPRLRDPPREPAGGRAHRGRQPADVERASADDHREGRHDLRLAGRRRAPPPTRSRGHLLARRREPVPADLAPGSGPQLVGVRRSCSA